MAATFDTPLPLPELQWKTFERFCVCLLQCLHPEAEIHLYGGEGHNQLGIDLRRRNDGEVWTFQAKQKKVFRPSDIRKIVAAHKVVSQKKIILLSRIATPAVRDEVDNHSDWEIWDQEDLSEKFRCLDPWDQHRLIDTYFPGQHLTLTGKLRSTTWLSPDEFFSHVLSAAVPSVYDFTRPWQISP